MEERVKVRELTEYALIIRIDIPQSDICRVVVREKISRIIPKNVKITDEPVAFTIRGGKSGI